MWTESETVNAWIAQGMATGLLQAKRQDLREAVQIRFPGAASKDLFKVFEEQDSAGLLEEWFRAALRSSSFAEFLAVGRR
jgi:hypothetical protein